MPHCPRVISLKFDTYIYIYEYIHTNIVSTQFRISSVDFNHRFEQRQKVYTTAIALCIITQDKIR